VDGAFTVIVVEAGAVMSSESWSPSLVVHVTEELTGPIVEVTFMMIVAEALAFFGSVPKVQIASPDVVVHDPDELTLEMLNPAGAGAWSVVFGSAWNVWFVKVVLYAMVVPAVTGFGEPVSVAVAVPPLPWSADAGAAAARMAVRMMSGVRNRRMGPPCQKR
jgi:hypothetical protein